ncbi:MAG: response regulator, partial [Bacteroidia bacterium]|nr:response regulator [Bacteroidia bacterium]
MRILIIEDEQPASTRLKKLLLEAEPNAVILDEIVSIKSAVEWFKNHSHPDLIFMDIHLADGNSFDIFELVNITTPVIFITAYDEFALKAFKVNCVEYLLKPVKQEELVAALNKFKTYFNKNTPLPDLSKLMENLKDPGASFKKRFLIR